MDNWNAPQWVDFTQSPQVHSEDYFDREHIELESGFEFEKGPVDVIEKLDSDFWTSIDSESEYVDAMEPPKMTPIKVISPHLKNKEGVKETTYMNVLIEAMDGLQLSSQKKLRRANARSMNPSSNRAHTPDVRSKSQSRVVQMCTPSTRSTSQTRLGVLRTPNTRSKSHTQLTTICTPSITLKDQSQPTNILKQQPGQASNRTRTPNVKGRGISKSRKTIECQVEKVELSTTIGCESLNDITKLPEDALVLSEDLSNDIKKPEEMTAFDDLDNTIVSTEEMAKETSNVDSEEKKTVKRSLANDLINLSSESCKNMTSTVICQETGTEITEEALSRNTNVTSSVDCQGETPENEVPKVEHMESNIQKLSTIDSPKAKALDEETLSTVNAPNDAALEKESCPEEQSEELQQIFEVKHSNIVTSFGLPGPSSRVSISCARNHQRVLTCQYRRTSLSKYRRKSGKYVSLAEAVSKFQTGTPKRFRTKSNKKAAPSGISIAKKAGLQLTHAVSPVLRSKTRVRQKQVLSQEQREKLELEDFKKHQIKANPVPTNILKQPGPLKKVQKKPVTVPQPFHLTGSGRPSASVAPSKPKEPARELHHEVPHRTTVPKHMKKKCTEQIPFSFEERKKELRAKPSGEEENLDKPVEPSDKPKDLGEPSTSKLRISPVPSGRISPMPNGRKSPMPSGRKTPSKKTAPQPFSFEERNKLMLKKREERIKQLLEEDKKGRNFHANPVPKFKAVLPKVDVKKGDKTSTTKTQEVGPMKAVHAKAASTSNLTSRMPRRTIGSSTSSLTSLKSGNEFGANEKRMSHVRRTQVILTTKLTRSEATSTTGYLEGVTEQEDNNVKESPQSSKITENPVKEVHSKT
ncbi:uncharacterized protein LOC105703186 isoform X2 [Orussus abietinus]|uniref:uncharacterized protein LOC105703186 isoform X2 n=1 Tax=Orussus abietinus TaxID=222816 RepID=UPI000626AB9A|nr:uncharacterized protein LOC105703186 isoform X2 [Orussus abietinus]